MSQNVQELSISADSLMAEVDALLKGVASEENTSQQVQSQGQSVQAQSVSIPVPVSVQAQQKQSQQVKPVVYPEGTPNFVIDAVESDLSTEDKVYMIVEASKDDEAVLQWGTGLGKVGAPPKALRHFTEVRKLVREKLGAKPKATAQQVQKNISKAVDIASMLLTKQTQDKDVLQALTPGSKPLLRLVNPKTNKVFLLWTDYLAASKGDYQLRLRKYTVGDKSKPSKAVPSVYLMKGDKVLVSMNPEEFVVLLNLVKELSSSNKMDEIFQAFISLSQL